MSNRNIPAAMQTAIAGISTAPVFFVVVHFAVPILRTSGAALTVTGLGAFLQAHIGYTESRSPNASATANLSLADHDGAIWTVIAADDILGTRVEVFQGYQSIADPAALSDVVQLFDGEITGGQQAGNFIEFNLGNMRQKTAMCPAIPLHLFVGNDIVTAGTVIRWGNVDLTIGGAR